MPIRAVLFDFNGTLSNDEPVLCEIFCRLFAEQGVPLSAEEYYERLAGLSDPEIAAAWLGPAHPALPEVVRRRTDLYRAAVADGSTIEEPTREAFLFAAEHGPVGIVSGAAREEIEAVVSAAGLAEAVAFVIAAEDVERGKPDPEGYLRALDLLPAGTKPPDILVLEDSEAGIAAAKAAGMFVIAVTGTLAPDRLRAADALADGITTELIGHYLSPPRLRA